MRQEIQRSPKGPKALAKQFGINPKTAAKWKQREFTNDKPMGPKIKRSTTLSAIEEALIITFRKYTLVPLDDCLTVLEPFIPRLTRSSLHRCFQRNGISRLPEKVSNGTGETKTQDIGKFCIDIEKISTWSEPLYLLVAVDHESKFAHAEIYRYFQTEERRDFVSNLSNFTPYKIHTIQVGNSFQEINGTGSKAIVDSKFQRSCNEYHYQCRFAPLEYPWTTDQTKQMHQTIKEARCGDEQIDAYLKWHLYAFLMSYNYARKLSILNGLTPYQYAYRAWKDAPENFDEYAGINHFTLGLKKWKKLRK